MKDKDIQSNKKDKLISKDHIENNFTEKWIAIEK